MTVTELPVVRTADRLRVLVVSESFLSQINGVTNSVRRVLEHLAATGHQADLVAPTGPATYAGFPVIRARGANLWFYRDFRIGLETRRRLRAVMNRFRRTVLWPRGVDVETFHPSRIDHALRRRLAPDGRPIVGYVGRLAAEKELPLLTHLAGEDRYALVVVGGGPEEQRLRGLLPGAHFLGVLQGEELGAAYASLDVFVHTGRHETFCPAAQEALASGVPVVAPRSGGPVDIVDDGVTGLLYRPGDGEDLRRSVDYLAHDPVLRRTMGRSARRAVQGRSWQAINDRLIEHYREVVDDRLGRFRLSA